MSFSLYYSRNDFLRSRAGRVFVNRAARAAHHPTEDHTVRVLHGSWGKTVVIDDDAFALLPEVANPSAANYQELQRSAE